MVGCRGGPWLSAGLWEGTKMCVHVWRNWVGYSCVQVGQVLCRESHTFLMSHHPPRAIWRCMAHSRFFYASSKQVIRSLARGWFSVLGEAVNSKHNQVKTISNERYIHLSEFTFICSIQWYFQKSSSRCIWYKIKTLIKWTVKVTVTLHCLHYFNLLTSFSSCKRFEAYGIFYGLPKWEPASLAYGNKLGDLFYLFC